MVERARNVPDGYHTVTPYLTVHGAVRLIEFLKQAFDARETERVARVDGTIAHAEVKIGDSYVMLNEATGGLPKPMCGAAYLYVDDTDATYERALHAGATSLLEPQDTFYGDRNAGVEDPCGNYWWLATPMAVAPPEDVHRSGDVGGTATTA